ncbi:transposase, partial [Azospirillum sp.]|uniref:transposase n=1 Tax=Azospirillum sp. TaxID=34012 RepID=UPI003D75B9A1
MASLVGLDPVSRDSGKRSAPRAIAGGRPIVRTVLCIAALLASRWRPVNRLRTRGFSKFCVDHRGVFRFSRFASGVTEDPTAQQV